MAFLIAAAKGRALGNVLVGFALLAICLLASSVSCKGRQFEPPGGLPGST